MLLSYCKLLYFGTEVTSKYPRELDKNCCLPYHDHLLCMKLCCYVSNTSYWQSKNVFTKSSLSHWWGITSNCTSTYHVLPVKCYLFLFLMSSADKFTVSMYNGQKLSLHLTSVGVEWEVLFNLNLLAQASQSLIKLHTSSECWKNMTRITFGTNLRPMFLTVFTWSGFHIYLSLVILCNLSEW